jgi:hypothetical protein
MFIGLILPRIDNSLRLSDKGFLPSLSLCLMFDNDSSMVSTRQRSIYQAHLLWELEDQINGLGKATFKHRVYRPDTFYIRISLA